MTNNIFREGAHKQLIILHKTKNQVLKIAITNHPFQARHPLDVCTYQPILVK